MTNLTKKLLDAIEDARATTGKPFQIETKLDLPVSVIYNGREVKLKINSESVVRIPSHFRNSTIAASFETFLKKSST